MRSEVTYCGLIVEALTRFPNREAFIHGDRRVSYRQAAHITAGFLAALQERGVGRGDAVALLAPNSPELWLVQAATYLLGARCTGLNLTSSQADHIYVCDDAEISVLVAPNSLAHQADALHTAAATVKHVLLFSDADPSTDSPVIVPRVLRPGPASGEDVAWLPYTGGTTGRPKGVMVPHRALLQQTLSHLASWGIPEQPRYLAAGPMSHASGLPVLPTLLRGGTVVIMDSFDPDRWLQLVHNEHVNFTFIVPTMLYSLLDAGPESFDLSSLQTVNYGAAPTSTAKVLEAMDRIGPVFQQVYGQTEVASVATSLRRDEHDPNRTDLLASCGRPVVGAEVGVLDENGQPMPSGQVGELSVRTAAAMLGYRNRPTETAEVLRDGWVRTGDMAYQDDDGFYHLVDRKKDMIISGGYNVYSREVEDVLLAHPAVAGAAVIGVPDQRWGEAVTAVIVRRHAHSLTEAEIIEHVRLHKGPIHAPKSVEFVDDLPMTPLGKIDKKRLREPYWSSRNRNIP
jgi:fatty-acyl-CoA synthase